MGTNRSQVLGTCFDLHHVHSLVVDPIAFVEARMHQTQGGADTQGEVGMQRSEASAYGRLE